MGRCASIFLGCLLISSVEAGISVSLQGQLGGESRAVAVSKDGTLAYLGVGPRVVLLNLSDPNQIRELGQSEVLPDVVEDIVVQDDYAFVADGPAGLFVLDVSDVKNPAIIGKCGGSTQPVNNRGVHVCLSGRHVFFADGGAGLRIFDVSYPAEPVCVATLSDVMAFDVAVAGRYAYAVTSDRGLIILDVSDPAHPRTVAQLTVPFSPREIEVSGDYAFLTGQMTTLADRLGLYVVDVHDPVKPVLGGQCDLTNPGELVITEKLAYVANGWYGIEFIRITNPMLPARIGAYDTEGYVQALVAVGGHLYAAQAYAGLEVIDVSRPAQPLSKGRYATTSIFDVDVSGAYAYTASGNAGLQVIDVSNPNAPAWVSWLDFTYASCVTAAKECVCVGDNWQFITVDVSTPANPKVIGSCEAKGEVHDIDVVGTHAYVAAGRGLTVLDISIPRSPVVAGRCELTDYIWDVCISDRCAYAVGIKGLDIIDISDPTKPLPLGRYQEWYWPYEAAVWGDYVYLANMDSGMVVIDVSDPWLPGRVRRFDTTYARGIVIQGKYAYLADMREGLHIFDVSNPGALARVAQYEGACYGEIAVSGNLLYAADQAKGLAILKIAETDEPNGSVSNP